MRKSLLPLSLLIACVPAWADSAQQQVESYLSHRIETALNGRFSDFENLHINFRIANAINSLPTCEQPLFCDKPNDIFLGTESWWIECGSEWRVKAVTTVSIDTKVVATKGPLKKGHRIGVEDLNLRMETLRLKGTVYQYIEDVVGNRLRRSVRADQVLTQKHLELEHAVTKGHHVTITFHSHSFSLETMGVALDNGMVGDRIKVVNSESGRELSVVVTGENSVEQR